MKQTEFNKAMSEIISNNEKKLMQLNKKQLVRALAMRDVILKMFLVNDELLKVLGKKTKTEIILELTKPKEKKMKGNNDELIKDKELESVKEK